ncbi:carboxypeptidase-like regulatory domain-containing protein [Poritiphilus flavus]|uniref:CarboxypepD_reg-like domain-containing protein n=1 Tax=Poritiphilus flavus TaxID=2697053 RepID=A0A6L9EHD5_9FLAO|nr:carboxypeptidase-like regulatory domain-containing protein [Poritiphilus flavus]NAS14121.1 hypothetical protein [Poritiphilus flavus]
MPKNRLFLLLFLLTSIPALAQNEFRRSLEGSVRHQGKIIQDVHVMNITSNKATITDANGNFSISVRLNDTIRFSAVQYKKKQLVITASILESKGMVVSLEQFVNELDEVVVRPYDLSGDIARDMQNLKTDPVVTASTLGLPNAYARDWTQSERMLNEATTGGGIVPLNPILNAITGRTKMLKKRLARDEIYARTGRVRNFYVDSLFVQELLIPKEKIEDFMYYCEVDSSFSGVVDTHDRLKIWEFLKKKSTAYRKNNALD